VVWPYRKNEGGTITEKCIALVTTKNEENRRRKMEVWKLREEITVKTEKVKPRRDEAMKNRKMNK
jgi:hypothetical protein